MRRGDFSDFSSKFFFYLAQEHYLSLLSFACFPFNTIQGSKLILLSFQEFSFFLEFQEMLSKHLIRFRTLSLVPRVSFPEIQETICNKLVPSDSQEY